LKEISFPFAVSQLLLSLSVSFSCPRRQSVPRLYLSYPLVVFVSAPSKLSFPGREFGVAGTPRERPEKLELMYVPFGTYVCTVCIYVKKKNQGISIEHFFKANTNITGFVRDPD
jgi:hypothetical protein